MGLFNKLFKKKNNSTPRGFYELAIKGVDKITSDTVKISLEIPDEVKNVFHFKPGQYLDFEIEINGEKLRRSYSICSGKNEDLSVAVKQVENGKVSSWFNQEATIGMPIIVGTPNGNFIVPEKANSIVAIAAGSGITPIMSIAKELKPDQKMTLIFGNRKEDSIIFKSEIDQIATVRPTYFLSGEEKDGFKKGRISAENFNEHIKTNLDLLKADYFLICGPEEMIHAVNESLHTFGIPKEKIKFELFTTPVLLKEESPKHDSNFNGKSTVSVILDDEKETFELDSSGKSILEVATAKGMDAPYSCKGGVCSSCKAKVIKGSATMDLNYVLTDQEIEEGYILTCQAHPSSEELVISYDD